MEVPMRLVRREVASLTDAFLLFADDPAPLAVACVRLGGELPRVFAVKGGFLLVPRETDSRSLLGAVRLRRLSGDFFIPADADLLPALLTDELTALTHSRGLVALPGGTLLAFDATNPLPVSHWLAPSAVRRSEWEPFPQRPDRAGALTVIERPSPPVSAIIELLGEGAPDGAKPLRGPGETPGEGVPEGLRPQQGSFISRNMAGAGLATAQFLAWLGKQLGAEGLARAGGNLARRMLEFVPRLSEKVLGEQEAALRDVLRELQAGDVEKGLRYAPPAYADPDQPAQVGTDARLGTRDPRYSLSNLLGFGGGIATAWLGGGNVWEELAREYRRLATEAAARGDHRRAAYLYGVLLRDLRSAANVLMAGGLYRDAALLFRDRLKDLLAAAEAFERAGDHDEALRLYDKLSQFERAGDLLHRLGEGVRAIDYYRRAAAVHAAAGRFLAAGDLMLKKGHLRGEANQHYHHGWWNDGAEALTCAERLLDDACLTTDSDAFEGLWSHAEHLFADRPRDASRFFNYALRIADLDFLPENARADLQDRARLHFASHLRAHAMIREAEPLVGELFPVGQVWGPPVGRDAAFAIRNRRPESVPQPRETPNPNLIRITKGEVTAVISVRGTFDLVVASTQGIFYWKVSEGRVVPVWDGRERITALSASVRGEIIYAVTQGADEKWRLCAFAADRTGAFRPAAQYVLPTDESEEPAFYLQPAAMFRDGEHRVTVATPKEGLGFYGPYLQQEPTAVVIDRPVYLIAEAAGGYSWYWKAAYVWCRRPDTPPTRATARFTPTSRVDWLTPAPGVLETATLYTNGNIYWAEFNSSNPDELSTRNALASHRNDYAAVCLIASGTLAAITTGNELCWLRVSERRLIASQTRKLDLPVRVVALTVGPNENEVIVILADGRAVRVPRP